MARPGASPTNLTAGTARDDRTTAGGRGRLARALRIEWLGQTAASVFWITSVFAYGISSTGDWLQLMAASAWLVANIAVIVSDGSD